ncbi:hypothetical protein K438DRAFT_1750243 [Mycena galopus ATCC 62051]|nr:hypothetical protein K438DRAFT_1750243 [Mycena galopus ATCC 62051]
MPQNSGLCDPDPANTVADRINTLLNSSGPDYVVSLCPNTEYLIQSPLFFAAANQEISTLDYPTDDSRATLVVNGPVANGTGHTCAVNEACGDRTPKHTGLYFIEVKSGANAALVVCLVPPNGTSWPFGSNPSRSTCSAESDSVVESSSQTSSTMSTAIGIVVGIAVFSVVAWRRRRRRRRRIACAVPNWSAGLKDSSILGKGCPTHRNFRSWPSLDPVRSYPHHLDHRQTPERRPHKTAWSRALKRFSGIYRHLSLFAGPRGISSYQPLDHLLWQAEIIPSIPLDRPRHNRGLFPPSGGGAAAVTASQAFRSPPLAHPWQNFRPAPPSCNDLQHAEGLASASASWQFSTFVSIGRTISGWVDETTPSYRLWMSWSSSLWGLPSAMRRGKHSGRGSGKRGEWSAKPARLVRNWSPHTLI